MIYRLLVFIIIFSVLQGCAQAPKQSFNALSPAPSSVATEQQQILYKLLVAEIAGQRGYLDVSIEHLLTLALELEDPRIAERAARAAIYAKQTSAAASAAKRWVALDPHNIEARQVAAALALRQHDAATATEHLRYILLPEVAGPERGFMLSASLLGREAKDNQNTVLSVMQGLVNTYPDNAYAYFANGTLAMLLKQPDLAEPLLLKALELKPDLHKALILYAHAKRDLGQVDIAIQKLSAALEEYGENDELRLAYSRMLLSAKRYPEAKDQFEVLLTTSPDNMELVYTLALLNLDMDQHDQALAYLQQLLDANKRTIEAHYYIGRVNEIRRNYSTAIESYSSVNRGNYRVDAQIRAAHLLGKLDRIDEARQRLQSLRASATQNSMITRYYLAESEILTQARDYAEAATVLSQALEEMPGNTDLLYTRGLLYEKLDRLDLLEMDLRAVLLREPENANALNALGYTLADRTERYQEAYEFISRAYKLEPESAAIIDSLGWVLYRMGRHQEALTYLQKALDLAYDAEIAAHLGEVLWVMGNQQEAETVLKQALERTPDDKNLLNTIKQMQGGQF